MLVPPRKGLAAVDSVIAGNYKRGALPPLWDGHASERIVDILRPPTTKIPCATPYPINASISIDLRSITASHSSSNVHANSFVAKQPINMSDGLSKSDNGSMYTVLIDTPENYEITMDWPLLCMDFCQSG